MNPAQESDGSRLDKWLWFARFYKTRSLATAAISGGKVHLNAERVKPAHAVRPGDRITLSLEGIVAEFEVLGSSAASRPGHRGARLLSRDTRERRRGAPSCAISKGSRRSRGRGPETRPDKRDRRRLMRLHRDQM